MQELTNFIAGQWQVGKRTFVKTSPFHGQAIATVHEATESMVDEAVRAAHRVSIGDRASAWGNLAMTQRLAILEDFADRLMARVDDLVEAEVLDTGRSYWQACNFDGARAAKLFRAYASAAENLEGRSKSFSGAMGKAMWYTNRRPKGVIGCITPWNMPLLMMCMKVAPALVMGNGVVAKPSEETPSSSAILAEVIAESDIPDGVFSLVHGFGAGSAGEYLTRHPLVNAFNFTGESATGAQIMQAASVGLREVSLELGGKNAALIFQDANMDHVIDGVRRSSFFNSGQICFCTERAYVHRSRYDEFIEKMAKAASDIVIGDLHHEGFSIGPLVSHAHRDKVKNLLDTVVEDGGEFVAGGDIPKFGDERDNGAFILPSIAIGLPETARFVKQEAFGPVLHIAPFDDEQEAIDLANDTQYGLATSIWTENISRAHRVAPQVRVGHAWVNSWQLRDLLSPISGVGASGLGRDGGRDSLEFCSQPQTVTVRLFDQ